MSISVRTPSTMIVTTPPPPPQPNNHPPNNPLRDFIRSPRFATLYAILATLAATVSYTSYLSGTSAGSDTFENIAAATCLLSTLLALHIPLLLNAPALRNHPAVRALNPNPVHNSAVYVVNLYLSIFLTNVSPGGPHLYSIVSAVAYMVDIFFMLLCLLPGWRNSSQFMVSSLGSLVFAVAPLARKSDFIMGWLFGLLVVIFLLIYVHHWIHYDL